MSDAKDDRPLSTELAALWRDGNYTGFYALVAAKVVPEINAELKHKFNLNKYECEDCSSEALSRLVDRVSRSLAAEIHNPRAYLHECARNEALRVATDRGKHEQYIEDPGSDERLETLAADHAGSPGDEKPAEHDHLASTYVDPAQVSGGFATLVIEELTDEFDASGGWVQEVLAIAVSRLSPRPRQVMTRILAETATYDFTADDFAYDLGDVAAELGMTEGAVKAAKSRAYSELRKIIPFVINELGVNPPKRAIPSIFHDDGSTGL
jgi:DNA-directed RNA polymerase specialized sigma24 family protein